jgi:lysophospholipase L1-like esterase
MRKIVTCIALLLTLSLVVCNAAAAPETREANKITVFGSSVASGIAAEQDHGYWYMLKDCLQERGWDVSSCSRGGDRTTRILDRFDDLLAHQPDYVFIGLSLANEGIRTPDRAQREAVYRQYKWGLQSLIELIRSKGMTPVVGLCYPNGDYTAEEYDCVKRMNLLINTWNVPSANFLGAIGDEKGRWVKGYQQDPGHPNTAGHREMFYAIVPGLFDALAAGIPIPLKADGSGFLSLGPENPASVRFQAADTMHSWATAFYFRCRQDGGLAAIESEAASAEISILDGKLAYQSLASESNVTDGQWHQAVISHRYAQRQTQLFVDGRSVGTLAEQVEPNAFMLGGDSLTEADYKEWLVYRAALNDLEVQALWEGQLLQASLEVYAPLQDPAFTTAKPVENRAQSLSQVMFRSTR